MALLLTKLFMLAGAGWKTDRGAATLNVWFGWLVSLVGLAAAAETGAAPLGGVCLALCWVALPGDSKAWRQAGPANIILYASALLALALTGPALFHTVAPAFDTAPGVFPLLALGIFIA